MAWNRAKRTAIGISLATAIGLLPVLVLVRPGGAAVQLTIRASDSAVVAVPVKIEVRGLVGGADVQLLQGTQILAKATVPRSGRLQFSVTFGAPGRTVLRVSESLAGRRTTRAVVHAVDVIDTPSAAPPHLAPITVASVASATTVPSVAATAPASTSVAASGSSASAADGIWFANPSAYQGSLIQVFSPVSSATTTVPTTTAPTTMVPITTVPTTTVPTTTVPITTVPITTVPITTVPITTVAPTTLGPPSTPVSTTAATTRPSTAPSTPAPTTTSAPTTVRTTTTGLTTTTTLTTTTVLATTRATTTLASSTTVASVVPTTVTPTTQSTRPVTTIAPDCAVRVWPLGDSLTVGGYGDRTGFTDSYRYELYRQLAATGQNIAFRGHIGAPGSSLRWGAVPPAGVTDEFSHSGVGGYSVADMLLDVAAFSNGVRPDVIVLNIGTNGGTPQEIRQLVTRLQQLAPIADIVMGTLTPLASELALRRVVDPERAALNAAIRAIGAESASDRLFTADVTDRLFNQQAMTASDYWDGTHLEASGGMKFARALYPEVAQRVAQARRC